MEAVHNRDPLGISFCVQLTDFVFKWHKMWIPLYLIYISVLLFALNDAVLGVRPSIRASKRPPQNSMAEDVVPSHGSAPLTRKCFTETTKSIKIPVWPVWGGVFAQLAEWMGATAVSESILRSVGGRVIPITLGDAELSPFLLLAHHMHSFTPFDPTRQIVNAIQPEGFPAHPHAGFSTVTITIEGGLRHRDSSGESSSYGDGDVQFMNAGAGIVHEEMWDVAPPGREMHQRIEIYQVWVNSPLDKKFLPSQTHLLSAADVVAVPVEGGEIKLISGDLQVNGREYTSEGSSYLLSRCCIATMSLPKGVSVDIEASRGDSCAMYIRTGSAVAYPSDGPALPGDLVKFSTGAGEEGERTVFEVQAGDRGLEALLLIGEPLREPALMRGPFVQASEEAFARAAQPFQLLGGDLFWDHTIKDAQWEEHIARYNLPRVIEQLSQY